MRSPSAFSCVYWDSTDDSAVYSLTTLGRERLVAGTSRHSVLKFFDLRVSGGRAYHYADISAASSPTGTAARARKSSFSQPQHAGPSRAGWNLFLNPRNTNPRLSNRGDPRGGVRGWQRRSAESPIYALSSPSACSPTLYAGVENNVVQLDFVAMLDAHPDPIFKAGLVGQQQGKRHRPGLDVKKSWDPRGDVLNLAMYEQESLGSGGGEGAMRLRVQRPVGRVSVGARALEGYDERWRDGSDV